MDNLPDEGRCKAEGQRLVRLLLAEARSREISIRSLERKVGVGDSVFAKVLSGKVTVQLRHILLMCDGLGLEWKDFFALAYPPGAEKADEELDHKIHRYLIRVGLLHEEAEAEAQAVSADEH
jgi:transcriptional regulator with XRE-family HTH domain